MSSRPSEGSGGQDAGSTSLIDQIKPFVVFVIQAVLTVEILLLMLRGHFFSAFLAGGVLMLPVLFRKIRTRIPAELQLAAILFAFTTLFLGEVRDYYELFWWWDLVIHFSSGLLLGLLGFMLVYMINENQVVDRYLQPGFVALFAFAFAVALGAIWEVFEFAVDQGFGTRMQKPRPGDPSGLTDTMWDMSVNIAGAALISLAGWRRHADGPSGWLKKLIRDNPQLFGR
jgi:hypothetical protein